MNIADALPRSGSGGCPSLDGTRWFSAADPEHFLCDEKLMTTFRQEFCDGLEKLYLGGQLKLVGLPAEAAASAEGFRAWLNELRAKPWMVNQQGPPTEHATSEGAISYLARYMQGAAIGDHRLVSDDGEFVTFMAKDNRNDGQLIPVKVTGEQFVERFLLFCQTWFWCSFVYVRLSQITHRTHPTCAHHEDKPRTCDPSGLDTQYKVKRARSLLRMPPQASQVSSPMTRQRNFQALPSLTNLHRQRKATPQYNSISPY